jgi:FkbM family methyltransferase
VLALLDDLVERAGPSACFLDIGANVGHHTLYVARRGVRVIAIEPWDWARARLSEKVARNRLTNIQLIADALGARDEERPFFAPTSGNTGTGSLHASANAGRNRPSGRVRVRPGDAVLEELGLHGPAILKIDVEGAEAEVLQGLRGFLAAQRPAIVVESSPDSRATLAIAGGFAALLPAGYRIEAIERHGSSYRLADCDPARYDGMLLLTSLPGKEKESNA